ncbi:MAG: CDP-glycerol glycerophosphotransferase family protein [Janthinobacterium lividum]
MLSFLIPRDKKKWVFANYIVDAFNDNPKYLFIYVNQHCPDIKAIYITSDPGIYFHLNKIGLKVYMKNSRVAIWHCITAKVYFYNAYSADINYYTSGCAILVNLWHGVGLKKIEFNIDRGTLAERYQKKSFFYRVNMPWLYKRPTWFISSTEFQSIPFSTAFRIPLKKCLNFGYSRNDILLAAEDERLRFIQKYEREDTLQLLEIMKNYNKVYIYMPTWRDSIDFLKDTKIDFSVLNGILLVNNALLILKLHVNTPHINEITKLSNIILLHGNIDVYSILSYTHTLITDYSSILYDYILMPGKEVILYPFDYDRYVNTRDFNYPYLENVAGIIVRNSQDLYKIFDKKIKIESNNKISTIRNRFWGNYNGDASKKIVDFLYAELKIRKYKD